MSARLSTPMRVLRWIYPGQPLREGDPRLEAQMPETRAHDTRQSATPFALLVGLPMGRTKGR